MHASPSANDNAPLTTGKPKMFRIKICGITNVEDAIAAVDAGADAIGLNFYEKSPRCVTPIDSWKIAESLRTSFDRSVACVGLFVNHTYDEILEIRRRGPKWPIQLHGDEPPELLARFGPQPTSPLSGPEWKIIRARRFGDDGVAAIKADIEECARAGRLPDAVLLDAATPGRYGGTGESISWLGVADHQRWLAGLPLILAGGLAPDNVAEAIRIVRPAAVDVASGVESSPGRKDPVKVRDFVAAATAAFESLES
jgi:phosphoribosylanthranilate isomerase